MLAIALGGCAGRQEATAGPVHHQDVWEAVFLPEETGAALGDVPTGDLPGFDRSDYRLSLVDPQPLTASGDWPEPARASVENTRYISLPRQPNTILFFLPDRPARRGPPCGWWCGW